MESPGSNKNIILNVETQQDKKMKEQQAPNDSKVSAVEVEVAIDEEQLQNQIPCNSFSEVQLAPEPF